MDRDTGFSSEALSNLVSALNPAPNFNTLPPEILATISSYTDRPTALSLALTARAFTPFAQDRLWRSLDLDAHSPYRTPDPRYSCKSVPFDSAAGGRKADRHRMAVRQKVGEVLVQGTWRRWGLVKKVKICPRPGAAHGLVQILDYVSPNLRDLAILSRYGRSSSETDSPKIYENLDLYLPTSGLFFPHLTHLKLGLHSFGSDTIIATMCALSPNLLSLSVEFDGDFESSADKGEPDAFRQQQPTKIRDLVIIFDYPTGDDDDLDSSCVVFGLLRMTPLLRQLYVNNTNVDADFTMDQMSDALSMCEVLENVKCGSWTGDFEADAEVPTGFRSLKRYFRSSADMTEIFEYLPAFPAIEMVYFDQTQYDPVSPAKDLPGQPEHRARISEAQSMTPDFATRIRRSPHLRLIAYGRHRKLAKRMKSFSTVNFDFLAESSNKPGLVSSFRHGTSEILSARLYLDIVQIADQPAPVEDDEDEEREWFEQEGMNHFFYSIGEHERVKVFHQLRTPAWQVFTDLDGDTIPLGVIEDMREAEAKSKEEWYQRGVEVGDRGWEILTDWQEVVHGGVKVVTEETV